MKPIVLKMDYSGNIKLEPSEIEKMVNDAYEQGYEDGRHSVPTPIPVAPITTPTSPTTPWWQSPWYLTTDHTVTCTAQNGDAITTSAAPAVVLGESNASSN